MGILGKAIITSSSKKKTVLEKLGAVFAIDAAKSIPGEQWVLNRGSGGQVLRARYGSVARAEIRNGVGFVAPSNSGNTPSVPDAANLRISGTLEMLGRFEGNTRPATTGYLAIKSSDGTYANRWYSAILYNSGQLGLWCRDTAMNSVDKGSVSAIPSTTTSFWWKVNVNPATGVFNFYYAPDQIDEPTSWTDLGGTTGSFVGNAILTGSGGDVRGHHLVDGVQKRLMIRNAIGSGTVLDIDFTAQADLTTSFTCTTGQTVTVTAANAVDTNDPLWLPWNGENYVWVEAGGATNVLVQYQSFTGATSMRVETDQEINWSTVGQVNLIDVANLSLVYHQGGALICRLSLNSTYLFPQVTHGITGSRREKIAVECDISAGWVDFFRWVNGAWTQIGTRQTFTPNAWTNANSNQTALVGASSTANKFYSWKVVSGGTTVCELYAADATSGSVTTIAARAGATASVLRATSGRKTAVVTRPIWLFGTDDYLEAADNDLLDFGSGQDFTAVLVMRQFGSNYGGIWLAKRASAYSPNSDVGWIILGDTNDASMTLADGTNRDNDKQTMPATGSLAVVAGRQSGSTLDVVANNTTAATTSRTVGSASNSLPVRIGTYSASVAANGDFELFAVGIFRRALSAAEIAQIVSAYRAG